MRLRVRPMKATVPAIPLADVALTVFLVVVCAGVFSAVRGVGIRFESQEAGGTAGAVYVRVLSDGTARVDGERVAPSALAATVRRRLDVDPALRCVVHIVPEASYQTAIDALSRLVGGAESGGLGAGGRLSIPTQRDVEAFVAAAGFDPFEGAVR